MERKKLVVLSGAGVSAESGLKTFRDSDGLWEGYDIEDVATPGAWSRNPALVLDFYNYRRREVKKAEPNAAHLGLAAFEQDYDVTIITQNIDDLHERAGSSRVLHLHGEIFKMCSEADRGFVTDIRGDIKLGDLAPDGRQFRPDIVWFGEAVPMMDQATMEARKADIFVVIGTSLQVYPAAGLTQYTRHDAQKFIIDRKMPSIGRDSRFTCIEMPATEGVTRLKALLKK